MCYFCSYVIREQIGDKIVNFNTLFIKLFTVLWGQRYKEKLEGTSKNEKFELGDSISKKFMCLWEFYFIFIFAEKTKV